MTGKSKTVVTKKDIFTENSNEAAYKHENCCLSLLN
jgi:hypothetical protein